MRLSIDDIDLYCLGQRNTIPRDTIYSGVGYVYDSAGNVLYDSHAGLNLRYNDLNLIEKVMRGDTIVAKYSYLSDGTKFSATDSAGNGLYYSGSLIYTKHGAALTMESCAFTGGRFVATATGVEARYFVTDHLGSVRAVVNDDGEVLERNDYYPFGSRWDDGLLSDNRYRYNGKEAQAFLNNPYLDYGARQYDSDGAVWLGKDPLSEKYYPISPYSFCANNPIKFVDSDGRKVYYAPGVSQKFKDKFAATIKYMNSRGSAGDIASLEKSDKVYYIGDKDSAGKSNKFVVDGTQTTIYWDPDTAYQTTEGIWISPATVLAHEVGHAIEYDKQPNEFMQNVKKEDGDYDNVEERRNITTTEQKAARKHKEIKDGTVTRRNHKMADKSNVNNLTPYEIEDKFRKINEFINNSN
jgi:RHS repeat-associated protein